MPLAEPVARLTPAVAALLVVLAALGLGAAAVGVLAVRAAGPATETTATAAVLPGSAGGAAGNTSRAREVLREWDRRREAAWGAGDDVALAALYLTDAVAGRRDRALLRRWTARGATVTRLQPQVLALRVVREAPRHLVVRVTDRLGVVEATVAGESVALPHGRATTRLIDLRRGPLVTSRWRVASVRGLGAPGTLGG